MQIKNWLSKNYPKMKIMPHRDYFEYVYLASDLAELSGSDYSKIRNRLNKFKRNFSYKLEEISEDGIISKYNVGPGDIHNIVEMVEWLLHASREFARMYNYEYLTILNNLITRVHYGCKKELLNLVSLRGIGRIRARALFNENFKTVNELRGVPLKRLAQIKTIREGVAKSIKKQIGESDKGEDKELNEF